MSKDITDAITDINTILAAVTGINRTYATAPDNAPVGSGDLPCCIPIVETATCTAQAGYYMRMDYKIKYLLLVSPYQKSMQSIEAQCRPFINRVSLALFAHVQLNDAANVDHLGTSTDEPLLTFNYGVIPYAGQEYIGYTIDLNVTAKQVVTQGP